MSKRGEKSEYLSMSLSSSNENGAVPIIKNKYLTGGMKTIIHLCRKLGKVFYTGRTVESGEVFQDKKENSGKRISAEYFSTHWFRF